MRRRFNFDGMCGAPTLKLVVAQRPGSETGARHMRFVGAASFQTGQHGAIVMAQRAPVTGRRPDGCLETDDSGTNYVDARRPDGTVAVHPHLVRVIAGSGHAVERLRVCDGGVAGRMGSGVGRRHSARLAD